jgi:hypothetical protein
MILPLQKNKDNSAKYLILLGARGQKLEKTGFGVELGISGNQCVKQRVKRIYPTSTAWTKD